MEMEMEPKSAITQVGFVAGSIRQNSIAGEGSLVHRY
jgi:hypothetical protein